jgi:hypothetical protein
MEYNPDLDLIDGKFTTSFKKTVINGRPTQIFEIKNGDKVKTLTAKEYLRLTLDWYYREADNSKRISKKLNCIVNAESSIKRTIAEYNLKNFGKFSEDYSDILDDLDTTFRRLIVYKDPIEKRWNNIIVASIAVISAIIGAVLTTYLPNLKESSVDSSVVLKIHDTVYLYSKPDTSLVRLVK